MVDTDAGSIRLSSDPDFISFPSRRSTVHSTRGIVACTQPLACQAGIKILEAGGNAAVCTAQPTKPLRI